MSTLSHIVAAVALMASAVIYGTDVFCAIVQRPALAQVSEDIAPGVVMSPMGAWPKNAKDQSTVNAVNPFVFADLGNAPTFSDTRVEIEPAKASDS